VSTGNLNEQTAHVYGDHCLLTSNRSVMADINRIFNFLESPKSGIEPLRLCQTLMVCPTNMRREITALINREIKNAKAKKEASIILKLNSLSDADLIEKLYEAAHAGVSVKMIVRGIFCAAIENTKFKRPIAAISIVDEYLEHARVIIFHNDGKEKVYISSADWMVRNLDHRVEAAVPVLDKNIAEELKDLLNIQLKDNVKARWLDNHLSNHYVSGNEEHKVRSQIEIYNYLHQKTLQVSEVVLEETQSLKGITTD
jgi:polyphosphate kinase